MKVVTTDDALILVKKLDPMADEESFEENRESILSAAKNEEFLELSISGLSQRKRRLTTLFKTLHR